MIKQVMVPLKEQKWGRIINASCTGGVGGLHMQIGYAASKHPNPADLIFSNYRVKEDRGRCSGCETCVSRCGMNAVKINAEGVAETDPRRCIECELCVRTCLEGARELIPKPGEKHRIPPADTPSQMRALAKRRGVIRIDLSRIVSFGF